MLQLKKIGAKREAQPEEKEELLAVLLCGGFTQSRNHVEQQHFTPISSPIIVSWEKLERQTLNQHVSIHTISQTHARFQPFPAGGTEI